MSDDDKTEDPSPERRRKAREDGQFPRAKDAGALAATGAVMLVLTGMGADRAIDFREYCMRCFSSPFYLATGDPRKIMLETGELLVMIIIPSVFAAALAGTAIGFVEAGFQPRFELASPNFERLNPLPKLKQLFAPKEGAMNTLLSLARVGVVAGVAYSVLTDAFPQLTRLMNAPLVGGASEVLRVTVRLATSTMLSLAVMAAIDFGYSWFKHEKSLKMSRQELKEEHHQQEGDPQLKAKQKAKAREMLKKGIAKQVRESDVVVANPVHVAVAIRYRSNEGAPVVTAKGYEEIALYIKKLAREHQIPVVENRPLARALADRVKPGRRIPVDLYTAVAEVLAFVYRLKRRKLTA